SSRRAGLKLRMRSLWAKSGELIGAIFATRGDTPWSEVAPYIVVQCIGAILGTVLTHLMFDLAPLAIGIGRRASKCQREWPDQTPRTPFGLPEMPLASGTSRLSCGKPREAGRFPPTPAATP